MARTAWLSPRPSPAARPGLGALHRALRRFGEEDSGSVVIEALIILPLFIWAYIALFVYWDAYKSANAVQKASYTLADMITRESAPISTTYLNGLQSVSRYLVDTRMPLRMRMTSVTWRATDNRYSVLWSHSPGGAMPVLTNANLSTVVANIPLLADGDTYVIVEVAADYTPSFNVGLPTTSFREFVVMRPRFVPRVCLTGVACS